VEFILNHGGSDPQASGFIFHFQTYQAMIGFRDELQEGVGAAFHAPGEESMAEAWIVVKTAVLSSDYKEDNRFFIRV
jgi:hypothetical protein